MENFNSFSEDSKQNSRKKMIKIGIIVCVILIILLLVLIMYYKDVDAKTFKLYIDGTQVSVSSDFYITDEAGNIYVKAKDLATYIGWTYQNGEYGAYTEDPNSGYFQNSYETSSFTADSTTLKKCIVLSDSLETTESSDDDEETVITVNSEDGTEESLELDIAVITYENQLYVPFDCIDDICNCYGEYSENRMYIYESDYLLLLAQTNAASFGYTAVSGVYENIRALAYGMMIVQNSNGNYGVVDLYNQNADAIVGFKYKNIIFSQDVKEFFVETSSGVGIVDGNGNAIIAPGDYDDISILDNSLGLYLIEQKGNYGIINREGTTIVYADYDSIGLSEEAQYVFDDDENNNVFMIYDNTIVVENDGKYGFYNLEGTNVLKVNYQGIGYISTEDSEEYEESLSTSGSSSSSSSKDSSETEEEVILEGDSVLTIDIEFELDDGSVAKIQGIVVEQTGVTGETLYGIYDALQERLIIPCACTRIYSETQGGKTTYYLEYNGESFECIDYAKSHPDDGLYTIISEATNSSNDETDENIE